MTIINTLFITILLFSSEVVYFKLAELFNIIDKPNERSSHHSLTIRGGGIIFPIAVFIFFTLFHFEYPYFILGTLLIATISFIDDVMTLNNKIRLTIHLLSVLLLFYQWDLFSLQWYWLIIAGIFVIGTINAYNFMDGVNGITGGYSLITITTLYYINIQVIQFTNNDLLLIVGLSLLVFNFFNFRNKAKCFAGDVGSVSIAFILIFLIGQLILTSSNLGYILLFLIYGLDTASTVFFRKIRNENIFKAHRSHFYQYLANQLKWNHLQVSILYMGVQLLINLFIINVTRDNIILNLLFTLVLLIVFILLRFKVEGKKRLISA